MNPLQEFLNNEQKMFLEHTDLDYIFKDWLSAHDIRLLEKIYGDLKSRIEEEKAKGYEANTILEGLVATLTFPEFLTPSREPLSQSDE